MKSGVIFNDGVRGPETHAERALAIVGCGDAALLVRVGEVAIERDAAWLKSMLDIGVFSFSRELIQNGGEGTSMAACQALTAIVAGATRVNVPVTAPDGGLPLSARQLRLVATDDFQIAFGEVVAHAIAEDKAYKAHLVQTPAGQAPTQVQNEIDLLHAGLMACACALHRADLVAQIEQHRPRVAETQVDLDWDAFVLADHMQAERKMNGKDVRFLPSFFALQFGSLECLDVLREAKGKPLAYAYLEGPPTSSSDDRYVGICGHQTLGILESFDVVVPLCAPSVVQATIEADCYTTRPLERQRLANLSRLSLLNSASDSRLNVFAPVFEAVGGFAIDPTTTVVSALNSGQACYTKPSYGPVDWDAVFKPDEHNEFSLATMTVLTSTQSLKTSKAEYDAALAGAIEHAAIDGAFDAVRHVHAMDNPHVDDEGMNFHGMGPVLPQPMAFMVAEGFHKSMIALMKAGVNPAAELAPGALSLIQMADVKDPEMAHTMRTYVNRGRVLDLLEGMDMFKAKVSP